MPGASTFTVQRPFIRGGFHYLTVPALRRLGPSLRGVAGVLAGSDRATPDQYPNYFFSSDDTLNRVWYAGAYTVQTNLVRNDEGRAWPPVTAPWNNGATVGELGNIVLTDGAKRDRAVWPGDMGVSVPTGYVSLFETVSAKNSLQTMYNHQSSTGELGYAGRTARGSAGPRRAASPATRRRSAIRW